MMSPILLVVLTGLLLTAVGPSDKTDVVVLANGNEVLGELKTLSRGVLKLKTDSAGTLSIEWDEILKVTSPKRFRFETEAGEKLVGSLAQPLKQRVLVIVAEDGQRHEFEMAQIIRLTEFDEKTWERVDGYLNGGFSFTKSSDVGQYSFGAGISYFELKQVLDFKSSVIVTDQDDDDTASKADLDSIYKYLLEDRWFALGAILVEHNSELGLDLRATAAAGPGRFLIQDQTHELAVFGGPAVSYELPDGESANTELEALLGTQYRIFISDTPETNLTLSLAVFPGISETDRIRGGLNMDLSKELVEDFFWTLSSYVDFDSNPISDDGEKTDFGIVAGISYTF